MLAALLLPVVLAQVYTWTDAQGETHYTDDRSRVPKGVRARTVGEGEGGAVQVVPGARPAPQPAPPAAPEVRAVPARPREVPDEAAPTVRLGPLPGSLRPGDAEVLEAAVAEARASPALRAFGGLRWSIAVDVLETEAELRRFGVPEWAGGFAVSARQVYLLSPYLGRASGGRPRPWARMAVHEVAHAQQQQWSGGAPVPRWFREGYAMYVSGEEPGASAGDVAWWAVRHGRDEPLRRAWDDAQRADRALFAYGTSLAGLRLLVAVAGEGAVRGLLRLMRQGQSFEAAFARAAGEPLPAFEQRFLQLQRAAYQERGEEAAGPPR